MKTEDEDFSDFTVIECVERIIASCEELQRIILEAVQRRDSR